MKKEKISKQMRATPFKGNLQNQGAYLTKKPFSFYVEQEVETYLFHMNGHTSYHLYQTFLSEMERSLFSIVLEKSKWNFSNAARILGINRATLTKKARNLGLREK